MDHLKTSRRPIKLQYPVKVLYRQTNVVYSLNICGGINQYSIGIKVKIYSHFINLFFFVIVKTSMTEFLLIAACVCSWQ
jgi:hypothetical protein